MTDFRTQTPPPAYPVNVVQAQHTGFSTNFSADVNKDMSMWGETIPLETYQPQVLFDIEGPRCGGSHKKMSRRTKLILLIGGVILIAAVIATAVGVGVALNKKGDHVKHAATHTSSTSTTTMTGTTVHSGTSTSIITPLTTTATHTVTATTSLPTWAIAASKSEEASVKAAMLSISTALHPAFSATADQSALSSIRAALSSNAAAMIVDTKTFTTITHTPTPTPTPVPATMAPPPPAETTTSAASGHVFMCGIKGDGMDCPTVNL